MGSHHLQVGILVQDDKLDCFGFSEDKIWLQQNGLAFYLGPVLPPRDDGSSIEYGRKARHCILAHSTTGMTLMH